MFKNKKSKKKNIYNVKKGGVSRTVKKGIHYFNKFEDGIRSNYPSEIQIKDNDVYIKLLGDDTFKFSGLKNLKKDKQDKDGVWRCSQCQICGNSESDTRQFIQNPIAILPKIRRKIEPNNDRFYEINLPNQNDIISRGEDKDKFGELKNICQNCYDIHKKILVRISGDKPYYLEALDLSRSIRKPEDNSCLDNLHNLQDELLLLYDEKIPVVVPFNGIACDLDNALIISSPDNKSNEKTILLNGSNIYKINQNDKICFPSIDDEEIKTNENIDDIFKALKFITDRSIIEKIRESQFIKKKISLDEPLFKEYNENYQIIKNFVLENGFINQQDQQDQQLIKINNNILFEILDQIKHFFINWGDNTQDKFLEIIYQNIEFFENKYNESLSQNTKNLKLDKNHLDKISAYLNLYDFKNRGGTLLEVDEILKKLDKNREGLNLQKNFEKIINISTETNHLYDIIMGGVQNLYFSPNSILDIDKSKWIVIEDYILNEPIFISNHQENSNQVFDYLEDWRYQYNNACPIILNDFINFEIELKFYRYLLHIAYSQLKLDNILAYLILDKGHLLKSNEISKIDSINYFYIYSPEKNPLVLKNIIKIEDINKVKEKINKIKNEIEFFLRNVSDIINNLNICINALIDFFDNGVTVFGSYKLYNAEYENTLEIVNSKLDLFESIKKNINNQKIIKDNVSDLMKFKNDRLEIVKKIKKRLTI